MAIVYRSVKGTNLEPAEFDGNFHDVDDRLNAIETSPSTAVSIASFDVAENQLTITLTDASIHGPFTLPVASIGNAGEWQPNVIYIAPKFVTVDGSLYLIIFSHNSALTFDPAANDGLGHDFYQFVLAPPTQPNDLHMFVGGIMSNAQLLLTYNTTRRWRLSSGLVDSIFKSKIAASGITIVELFKDDTSIGTITWGADTTIPTVSFIADVTFEFGETFEIHGPAIADPTLANISFDIFGTRL